MAPHPDGQWCSKGQHRVAPELFRVGQPVCRACEAEASRKWRRESPLYKQTLEESRVVMVARACGFCGGEFTARRGAIYCSGGCKQRARKVGGRGRPRREETR